MKQVRCSAIAIQNLSAWDVKEDLVKMLENDPGLFGIEGHDDEGYTVLLYLDDTARRHMMTRLNGIGVVTADIRSYALVNASDISAEQLAKAEKAGAVIE